MKRTTLLGLGFLFGLATSLVASKGEACSASACRGGFSLPVAGAVPANLPALLWTPRLADATTMPGPQDVSLIEKTAAGDVEVPIELSALPSNGVLVQMLVKPVNPLSPNADYVLRSLDGCDPNAPPIEAPFHTVDAAPLPSQLGTVFVGGQAFQSLLVSTVSGSCSATIDATVADLSLMPTEDAAVWANALVFETLINGMPWRPTKSLADQLPPGESWMGRGKDRIFAACGRTNPDSGADQGLQPTTSETIVLRATLPGTNIVLETEPAFTMMSCPGIDYVDDPATSPSGSSGCCMAGAPQRSGVGFFLFAFAALFASRRVNRPSLRRDGNA